MKSFTILNTIFSRLSLITLNPQAGGSGGIAQEGGGIPPQVEVEAEAAANDENNNDQDDALAVDEDLDGVEFILKHRLEDLKQVEQSLYSRWKPAATREQYCENILATAMQLRQDSPAEQRRYQEAVFTEFRSWKKEKFSNRALIVSWLDRALKVKKQTKEKKQTSLTTYFKPSDTSSPVTAPKLVNNKVTAEKAPCAARKEVVVVQQGQGTGHHLKKLAQCLGLNRDIWRSNKELDGFHILIEDITKEVEKFQEVRVMYENQKCRPVVQGSQFQTCLSAGVEAIEELKNSLEVCEESRETLFEEVSRAPSYLVASVSDKAAAKVKEADRHLQEQLLRCQVALPAASHLLWRRLDEKDRVKRARSQDRDEISMVHKNLSRSWEECLDMMSGSSKDSYGVHMGTEDLERVFYVFEQAAAEGRTEVYTRELVQALGRGREHARGIQNIVVENLPVILFRTKHHGGEARMDEMLRDGRVVLANPSLLIDLYQRTAEGQDDGQDDEKDTEPPPGKLARGRQGGRTPGTRYIQNISNSMSSPLIIGLSFQCLFLLILLNISRDKDGTQRLRFSREQIKQITQFVQYCGTPAHNRRREDVTTYGGQGSGKY